MDKQESWQSIKGFELYEVSDIGSVRNIKTGKYLKMSKATGIGHYYTLKSKSKSYVFDPAVLVANAFIKNTNSDKMKFVDHINRNFYDYRACNLAWSSSKTNGNIDLIKLN